MTMPCTYAHELHISDIVRTSERQYGKLGRSFDVFIELSRGVPDSVLVCMNDKDVQFGLSGRQEFGQFRRLLDGTDRENDLGALLRTKNPPDSEELDLVVLVIGRMRLSLLEDELRELYATYNAAFLELEAVEEEF